jgi:hypothetical protein
MFAAIPCYVLGCVSVTRWRMVRRDGLLIGGVIALLLDGVMAGWLMLRAEEQLEREAAHPLVVIARDGVLLRRGNGEAFPTRYDTPVNRGVEGRLRFERGGWAQIELSGGKIGWVPRGGFGGCAMRHVLNARFTFQVSLSQSRTITGRFAAVETAESGFRFRGEPGAG